MANWKHVLPDNRWKPRSDETKKKLSEWNKNYWKTHPNPNLWKKMSEEQKVKISNSHLSRKFQRKQKIYCTIRWLKKYSEWRTSVFSRDDYTCKTCMVRWLKLHAHHIKSLAQIIKDNKISTWIKAMKCDELWDLNNWITLCEDCHKLTDNYMHKWHVN